MQFMPVTHAINAKIAQKVILLLVNHMLIASWTLPFVCTSCRRIVGAVFSLLY